MNELLKLKNIKVTNQRKTILEIINNLGEKATLKSILKESSKMVDTSTVYRIIELFIEKSLLEKRVNYNEEIYYVIKEEHGHYFTCIKCHKKEKIDDCPIKELEEKYEKEKGYEILNHVVLMDGICKKCNNK